MNQTIKIFSAFINAITSLRLIVTDRYIRPIDCNWGHISRGHSFPRTVEFRADTRNLGFTAVSNRGINRGIRLFRGERWALNVSPRLHRQNLEAMGRSELDNLPTAMH